MSRGATRLPYVPREPRLLPSRARRYPRAVCELAELADSLEAAGMGRKHARGPLHAKGSTTGNTQQGGIDHNLLDDIWSTREDALLRHRNTPHAIRLHEKHMNEKGETPHDLRHDATTHRMHRAEFVVHFLSVLNRLDPHDVLDASDFYNSLCFHNPNAEDFGLTLEEAREATERHNRCVPDRAAPSDVEVAAARYQ